MDPPANRMRRRRFMLEKLPSELTEEILCKCTVEVMRSLICVSPIVKSIVGNPEFQERYLRRNLEADDETLLLASEGWDFTTVNLAKSSTSSSFLHSTPKPTNQMEQAMGMIVSGYGKKVSIFKPTNGFSLDLPIFPKTHGEAKSYVGFDFSCCFYKILGMCKAEEGGDWINHHVLTLDPARPLEWRAIDCEFPHAIYPCSISHESKSICLKDTIFYPAHLVKKKKIGIMRFHLPTERYKVNEVPYDSTLGIYYWGSTLLEIRGCVGVSFLEHGGDRRIMILEDAQEDKWSTLLIQTPPSICELIKPWPALAFEGIARGGEVVYSQSEGRVLYLYLYNPKTLQVHKKAVARAGGGGGSRFSFWNFVELS
ncbi:unnamed protein product [Microthlaspi erraticum]|uniref:F-box associated beta-propeller type 3 domain-containing protein n=1 Tax=Microthlaspi erraticum TaxID=1685480 RepID=A0A6D2HKY0_9BRAS|nr:unnamed protein product [Microthlaspi erraticum]